MAKRDTDHSLSVAEAADLFEKHKRTLEQIMPEYEQAKKVLTRHFEKTGRRTYKRRIGCARSSQLRLDHEKVKDYLWKELRRFQSRVPVLSLFLIEKEDESE